MKPNIERQAEGGIKPNVSSSTVDWDDELPYDEHDPVNKMFDRLPFVLDWVEYKGETVIAQINYEASKKANKPMLDISYCMTKALNQNILFTCQYDKSKFKPSRLGMSVW